MHADVLVVGAGSAGCVLAERLSADPDCRVVVVESGPGPSDPRVMAQMSDGLRLPIGDASSVVRRYRKPTFTRTAPVDLRHEIAEQCEVVIEALAD